MSWAGNSLAQILMEKRMVNFWESLAISVGGETLANRAPGYWSLGQCWPVSICESLSHGGEGGDGTSWKQLGQDIIGEADGHQSGFRVSLSSDDNTLDIGANTNDGNDAAGLGHVRVSHRDGDGLSWKQLSQDIDDEAESGTSVALFVDGKL